MSVDLVSTYKLEFDANQFRGIGPIHPTDLDSGILWLNGESKEHSWNPPVLAYSVPENSEKIADVTWLGPGFFAFNRKAIDALEDLLRAVGELLPIEVEEDKLVAFNPLNIQDCLDVISSRYNIRSDGNMGRLLKPSIDPAKINEKALFQTPETKRNMLFSTDKFKRAYERAGLKGLIFIDCTMSEQLQSE